MECQINQGKVRVNIVLMHRTVYPDDQLMLNLNQTLSLFTGREQYLVGMCLHYCCREDAGKSHISGIFRNSMKAGPATVV